ncbi:MAG: glycoside hydrolase family 3 protein [Clostridiaceae bacterium]|nr:glycoside hydrolase family 3 protein [Clostridiaceae bacterium]
MYKKTFLILVFLWSIFVLQGCNATTETKIIDEEYGTEKNQEEISGFQQEEVAEEGRNHINEVIEGYIQNMTLEEKVGQVFIESLRYNENAEPMKYLSKKGKETIEKYHLGGVILFAENISTIEDTQQLIKDMQSTSNIPLFIAIDEEGGRVSRLNSSSAMPATKLPGNEILGKTENPRLAYEVGRILGRELFSLGINMNFAPVADVNTNPENPVIGDRSFGKDHDKVGEMVSSITMGIQDENISAVLKHFPGHGDTSLDTHKEAVVIQHDIERLKSIEFIPFEKGIDANVDGIMLAHIQAPKITGDGLPATFSKKIVTDILRSELNYQSLIITDALEMAAISDYWSSGEAAVLAFEAGADILLMPSSIEEAYEGLLHAIREKKITEERLDESIERILTIKYNRGILKGEEPQLDPYEILGSPEHREVVEKIATIINNY